MSRRVKDSLDVLRLMRVISDCYNTRMTTIKIPGI